MSTTRIRYVPVGEALERWDEYERVMDPVFEKQAEVTGIRRLDSKLVYQRVSAGNLIVLDGYAEDERCGFAMVTVDTGSRVRVFVVWFVHLQPGSPGLAAFESELMKWARRWRSRLVEYVSLRPGMSRLVRKLGHQPYLTSFIGKVK